MQQTRRLSISLDSIKNESIKAQLYETFAAYGVVECIRFHEMTNYTTTTVTVQFQRLSSAERLLRDTESRGKKWASQCEVAVPHAGAALLVTSPQPLDDACLRDVLRVPPNTAFEEKSVHVLDANMLGGGGAIWDTLGKAAVCVQSYAVGKYVGVLTFPTSHAANEFLTQYQSPLARTHHVYLQHLGPPEGELHKATQLLLRRRSVRELAPELQLRGFVVHMVNNSLCKVDAGIYREGQSDASDVLVLLEVRTNFLKVNGGDEVMVRVVDMSNQTAILEKVIKSNSASPMPMMQRRFMAGGSSAAGSHHGGDRNARGGGGAGAGAGAGGGGGIAGRPDLANRLQKMLKERRLQKSGADASASPKELVCAYPKGLAPYATMVIQIDRIGENGLHAHCVQLPTGETSGPTAAPTPTSSVTPWVTFLPSELLPPMHGVEWQSFAVEGERMSVCLLYCVSVGESAATLRCIVSKADADMGLAQQRGAQPSSASAVAASSTSPSPAAAAAPPTVGQKLVCVPGHVVTESSIGILESPSLSLPAYLLPTASAFSFPIFASEGSLTSSIGSSGGNGGNGGGGATSSSSSSQPVAELVVSEVVAHDAEYGCYGVAISEALYSRKRRREEEEEQLKKEETMKLVKERLAAVLGKRTAPPS